MLSWFNGADADAFDGCGGYTKYKKMGDVAKPGPAMTIVFVDERCDSINDGEWCTSMRGWPDKPALWVMIDFPGSYHGGAGGLSFVDGHSEIHKWTASLNTPAARKIDTSFTGVTATAVLRGDKDIHWMSYHAGRVSDRSY